MKNATDTPDHELRDAMRFTRAKTGTGSATHAFRARGQHLLPRRLERTSRGWPQPADFGR